MIYTKEEMENHKKTLDMLHSTKTSGFSLCQYKNLSCVRCCMPHIGGDSHMEDSADARLKLFNENYSAYYQRYGDRYVGPNGAIMKFVNFHPFKQPNFEVSHYEDSFKDAGREEMEKRFSRRRELFLEMFDIKKPKESLRKYAAKIHHEEGYNYKPEPFRSFGALILGGSVHIPKNEKGKLPECHLLAFLDENKKAGCLAHPLAETSKNLIGLKEVFSYFAISHTSCMRNQPNLTFAFDFLCLVLLKTSI